MNQTPTAKTVAMAGLILSAVMFIKGCPVNIECLGCVGVTPNKTVDSAPPPPTTTNKLPQLPSPTIPTVEVPKNCGPLKVEVPIALREILPPAQTEGLSEADRIVNLENRIRILAIHYEKHRVKLKSQIDEYNASCK